MTKVTAMDVMESIRARTLSALDGMDDVPSIAEHMLDFWIAEYPDKVKHLFHKGRLVEALMYVCKQINGMIEEISTSAPPDLKSPDDAWED